MRKVRILIMALSVAMLFACSKSGKGGTGSPDDYDAMGEGNIPLAEPGKELRDINYDFDSSALSSSAQGVLKENSRWMLDNPGEKIVVEGHADERGTSEYNLALGERRAKSAFDYLRSLGVKSGQMSTISYGEELPLDPASSESAWAKNRRAHFSVKR